MVMTLVHYWRLFFTLPLHKRIWHMAWPPMLANMTTPLLGLVDTAVVGHLETAAHLGAVAIGASIFSFLFWAFGFLRMGATGLTGQALGQQDATRIRELLLQSVTMGLVIGIGIILMRAPITDLAIRFMSPSDAVEPWARLYIEARIWSAPAVLAGYAVMGWFFGIQYSKGPLWMLLCINIANMLLDYLAVYTLNMGSEGVAWATVVAHYLGLALAWRLAMKQLARFPSRVPLATLLQWRLYQQLIQVNRYLFVRTVLLLLAMSFFTAQSAQQSDAILAANSVLLIFLMIISNALDGFAFAVESLCAETKGAKQRQAFINVVRLSTFWALLTAILLMLIFTLFGNVIIHLLTSVVSVQQEAQRYLPWLIALPLIGVWSFMLDGIFVGVTAVKEMQNTMIVSVAGVFFPLWYLTQAYGNHGLWWSFCMLFIARGISLYWFYRKNMREHRWFAPPRVEN